MTISRTIAATATDPKAGLTLDELAAFVQQALRDEVPGNAVLRARVNMRGGIKKLEFRP